MLKFVYKDSVYLLSEHNIYKLVQDEWYHEIDIIQNQQWFIGEKCYTEQDRGIVHVINSVPAQLMHKTDVLKTALGVEYSAYICSIYAGNFKICDICGKSMVRILKR